MPGQEWRLQIGKVRERQGDIIQLFRAQILTWRRRLQGQHGRPQRLLLEPCPEFRAARYGEESIDDRGVEGARSFVPRKLDSRLATTKLIDGLEKARREHDARRDGDCVTAAAARSATVPLFKYRQQRVL